MEKRSRCQMPPSPCCDLPRLAKISPIASNKRRKTTSRSAHSLDDYLPSFLPTSCLIPTFDEVSPSPGVKKTLKPRKRGYPVGLFGTTAPVTPRVTIVPEETGSRNETLHRLLLD